MKIFYIFCFALGLAALMPVQPAGAASETDSPSAGETAVAAQQDTLIQDIQLQYGDSGSYLSSQFAKSSGHLDEALHYLQKIHKKNPQNADITSQLMGMLLLSGNLDEAMVLAGQIHETQPTDAIPALMLVIANIRSDRLPEASQILENDFSEGKGQLWLPLVSGWLDAGQDKLKAPIKLESLTANVGRATTIVNYHLALIHSRAGFKEEAAQNFLGAIDDADNVPARMMEMTMAFYEQNGKPAALAPIVEAYKKQHPDEINWKPDLVASPQDGVAEVLFTMGSIMQTANLVQDSIIYFQLANYLKPDFVLAQMALAESYTQIKLYPQATAVYAKIPVNTRFYSRAQLHIAIGYERMGKLNQALSMLDKLSHELPESFESLVIKGDLLRIHKRFQEAIDSYTQAIELAKPKENQLWGTYFARGGCYERLGNWPEAEEDLRLALELKPDAPEVLNYLGYSLLVHDGATEEARTLIERALALQPDDAAIIDSMGWALFLAGDYEGAAEQLERAVEILPNDPSIYDHLGDTYWQLGRKTEARYQWERSLAYSPEEPNAAATRKKLKSGMPQLAQARPKVSAKAEVQPAAVIQE